MKRANGSTGRAKPLPLRMALEEREGLILGALAFAVLLILQFTFPHAYIFSVPLLGLAFGVQWVDLFFGLATLLCFAQPIYQYWVATRTIYAITDRRAFTLKPTRKGPIVQSYKNIQQIKRRDLPDGRGDLIFGTKRLVTKSSRFGARVHERDIGFFGIDNVREVEQLMIKTFRSGTESDESL
ncbi:MAG: hypothetical protein ABI700_15975 [Chloroflexota bacterium]